MPALLKDVGEARRLAQVADSRVRWLTGATLLASFAALSGCNYGHVIKEQDAAYCEAKGLPRGTDPNAQCALDREAERDESGAPAAEQQATIPSGPEHLLPPEHPGDVPQTVLKTVAPETMTTIAFAVSMNADCSANDPPVVRISKQPAHGSAQLVQKVDYPRFSLSAIPPGCNGAKLAGIAVEYKSVANYLGADFLEFEATGKNGKHDIFRIPITVEKNPPPDDL
jgi:hypothetical protein